MRSAGWFARIVRCRRFLAGGLVVASAALGIAAAPPAPPAGETASSPAGPRNFLLITVESLRSDRLGCYTGGRRSTPGIDLLAAGGLRFERAYTASTSTVPAIATLLTGRYPLRHGLRHDLGGRLDAAVPTIAALLRAAGYRTGAVVGTSHLDSDRGLDAGFEVYDDAVRGPKTLPIVQIAQRDAADVVRKGLEFLDQDRENKRPYFLWLDFYGLRSEYRPVIPGKPERTDDEVYTERLATLDTQIGLLLGGLRSRGDGGTVVIVAGSHGEGLGDHRETGHGVYLYETTLRVPLLIRNGGGAAPGSPGGGVVERVVGLVDLAATILDLAGVPAGPASFDGRSLRPLIEGAAGVAAQGRGPRYFAETLQPFEAYGWSPLFAVIDGDRKVIQGERLEAFDVAKDPRESRTLTPTPSWAGELARFGRTLMGTPGLVPAAERQRIAKEVEALDLPWAESPICLEKLQWPDPRDRVELNDRLFRARVAFEHGLVGRSAIIGDEILETDMANFSALEFYVYLGIRNNWGDALLPQLEIFQCDYPYRGAPYHYLAHFYEKKKDLARAEKAYRMFARLDSWSEEPFYDLACLYAAMGRKDSAFENLKTAIALGADEFATMRGDARLLPLRDDPRFALLLGAPSTAAAPPSSSP